MPLLFPGNYQATINTGVAEFATAVPVSFYYFPTNYVVLGGGLLYLLGLFFLRVPSRERWNYARYLIFIPGILGLVPHLLFSLDREILIEIYSAPWVANILEVVFGSRWSTELGVPLQAVTACFLVWRAFRMKGAMARWMTIPVSGLLVAATWIEQTREIHLLEFLSYGMIVAFPIVVIHHYSQKGVSLKRITVALVFGLGLSFLVVFDVRWVIPLAVVYLFNRKGITQFWMTTGILSGLCVFFLLIPFNITLFWTDIWEGIRFPAYSAVPFACLVLWNQWARRVVRGEYEEEMTEREA